MNYYLLEINMQNTVSNLMLVDRRGPNTGLQYSYAKIVPLPNAH